MVKAYLSGAGSTYSTSDGTKFSNKEQVAKYCSKIWDKVEFVKSESPACDFVVYGNGLEAPTPKKGSLRAPNTHAISFAAFENYLQDHAQRLGYTGGIHGIDEAIQKQQARVNEAEKAWKNAPSPDTWQAYNRELTALNNLKRQKAAMAGMPQPGQISPPPANVNVAPAAPYVPATNAEGESKRRRSPRLSSVTTMEAEEAQEAQEALAKRKRGKRASTAKGKGRKKKGARTTKGKGKKRYGMNMAAEDSNPEAVPMEEDREDEDEYEEEEEERRGADRAWENYSVHSESEAQAAAPKRGRRKGKTTKGKKAGKKRTTKGKSKGRKKKKTTGKGKRKSTSRR